ncbi:hypothetical protein [Asticcacaulis excentricus]|uniref:Uncharacterized protein n=1 Tax=Asticcacaulis excentricus (strain ATCC 15261 / DSM 4724 / KCTC 12464 / NCIMB 9791 / VKM B-1370 / CB 48) TaxID=573065 RepID=E8RVU7_ASTEC|nr:hypothetical protein [Asticcacaulis excentricus]ADU15369.1 hypothetical protein Astex_3758 [Asticcacaulis excentricus CB 48]
MSARNPHFAFQHLVELMSAHAAQSAAGTPVDRVEGRLVHSIDLARCAGLSHLTLWLERRDFQWLCNARGLDRLSTAAACMVVCDVPVKRLKAGYESHVTGRSPEGDEKAFPIILDPSCNPGFNQRVVSEEEKVAMLEGLRRQSFEQALRGFDTRTASRH